MPPGGDFLLGTTSRGQDLFWQLTVALRNTLLFGIIVAAISRVIALLVGLFAGYLGGTGDRLADAGQRHLHRAADLPDPGAVLLRHARPDVLDAARAGDGLPRLGL